MPDELAQAVAAADRVFDDPDTPSHFRPTTFDAAKAAVEQLGARLAGLPGTARLLVDRARQGGEMLSSDRLQGLSEIAQNAEDVDATRLNFRLSGSELTATHNGRPVTLGNVWALSLPWMTTKTSESESIGKFGIGLSTLRTISPTLDVYCWPYAFRIDGSDLTALDLVEDVEALIGDGSSTSLRLSLDPGVLDADAIVRWLEHWGDSALLFCQSLSEVSFETPEGILKTLRLKWSNAKPIEVAHLGDSTIRATTSIATAQNDQSWMRCTADIATPKDLTRQHKETGTTTPVGVAVPLNDERGGRIHAGFPLADIDVPVAANAQFDATTGRQGLLDNDWNSVLIDLVANLWEEVILELFRTKPRVAWRLVPLPSDPDAEPSDALDRALLHRSRTVLPERVVFDTEGDHLPLSTTAHEVALLEGVLTEPQIAALAKTDAALPLDVRDNAGRWRQVLDDWRSAGADLPDPVIVADALPLLEKRIEVSQAVAIASAAIKDDLETELLSRTWLSDDQGEQFKPPTSPSIWTFTTGTDQWPLDLGLARRLHPDTLDQGEATERVLALLRRHGALIDRVDPGAYLKRLATAGEEGLRMTAPLSDSQLLSIRDALENFPLQQQQNLGPGIGQAILIEAFEFTVDGKRTPLSASPSEVYLPKSIDKEQDSFAVSAGATPGILWAAPRYSKVLRSPQGRAGIGAQKFLRILGAETAPRVVPHPDLERRYDNDYRLGLPKYVSGGPNARSEFLTAAQAQYTLEDYDSPDLEAVLESIAADRRARQRRTRASALVSSLGRAWERISNKTEVNAADTYYGWQVKTPAPAFWVWRARTVEWLDNIKAVPSAPNKLWLRTDRKSVV